MKTFKTLEGVQMIQLEDVGWKLPGLELPTCKNPPADSSCSAMRDLPGLSRSVTGINVAT